jgi:branched-chain amino acid aminotransferase
MIVCFNDWFVLNGNVFSSKNFKLPKKAELAIYEVLRVIEGVPLFFEDHRERLFNSAKLKNVQKKLDEKAIISDINSLIKINGEINGNIRYTIFFYENETLRYAHYSKHEYPTAEMYKMGVKLKSLQIERPEPNIKTIHSKIKDKTDKILADKSMYEIALLNSEGSVTEGSRSNLFFLKGPKLYTAPDEQVLQGITRKHVIDIAKNANIELIKGNINFKGLTSFESAFITGTSPKILPIQSIDNFSFYPGNTIIKRISSLYEELINKYIEVNKSNY